MGRVEGWGGSRVPEGVMRGREWATCKLPAKIRHIIHHSKRISPSQVCSHTKNTLIDIPNIRLRFLKVVRLLNTRLAKIKQNKK